MLIESKSNLARLMATENIYIEQKKVSTAYFDIKNRILTIPVLNGNLSPELYDLLLGHEVGHALETPAEGWHDSLVDLKINRTILNVCEDARIEKKIKRKFPGIRISFVRGYRELMEMDFFGVKGTNLNNLNFIDRINLYTKGGSTQGIEFLPEEQKLLTEVESTETFQDVVEVAKKIQEFMKEELKKTITQQIYSVSSDDSSEGEEYEEIEGDFDESSMPGGDEDSKDSNDSESENKDEKSSVSPGPGKGANVDTLGKKPSIGSSEDKISSQTDKKFREKEKELHSTDRKGLLYSNIPNIDMDRLIIGYKKLSELIKQHYSNYHYKYDSTEMLQKYNAYKNESSKVVSYLVKEFELRKNATQLSRAKISKTGELNLKQIHNYNFTDDIFKRITTIPNGKSHGLVMFIDWSGSMNDCLNSTVKQLLNLVFFCKKLNIPFEVYAFSSHVLQNEYIEMKDNMNKDEKVGDIFVNNFSLLNIFSSRMKTKEFTEMAAFLLHYSATPNFIPVPEILKLAGTPLNESIISSFTVVEEFKKNTKVQIVNTIFLTDGEGSELYGCYGSTQKNTITKFFHWNTRIFFRDPVTKSTIEIPDNMDVSTGQTITLLKLLKERVGGNVIGFYIAGVREARSAIQTYSPATYEVDVSFLRKNKFVSVKNSGYDEYFILRADKLDTDDDTDFDVKSTTTRALVNAFSKYTTNRVANRLVLNRFINLIS